MRVNCDRNYGDRRWKTALSDNCIHNNKRSDDNYRLLLLLIRERPTSRIALIKNENKATPIRSVKNTPWTQPVFFLHPSSSAPPGHDYCGIVKRVFAALKCKTQGVSCFQRLAF